MIVLKESLKKAGVFVIFFILVEFLIWTIGIDLTRRSAITALSIIIGLVSGYTGLLWYLSLPKRDH